jgi:hypothetical protein
MPLLPGTIGDRDFRGSDRSAGRSDAETIREGVGDIEEFSVEFGAEILSIPLFELPTKEITATAN